LFLGTGKKEPGGTEGRDNTKIDLARQVKASPKETVEREKRLSRWRGRKRNVNSKSRAYKKNRSHNVGREVKPGISQEENVHDKRSLSRERGRHRERELGRV